MTCCNDVITAHCGLLARSVAESVALTTLSPVLRGEGRVRGQRVAIWRGSQVNAFVPSPKPLP